MTNDTEKDVRRAARRRRRRMTAIRNAFFVIALLLVVAGYFAWQHFYGYSNDTADLNAYFGVPEDGTLPVIMNGADAGFTVRQQDGAYYVKEEDLKARLNDRFYIAKSEGQILYTTATATWTNVIGENGWTTDDGRSGQLEAPLSFMEEDTVYVNLDYVKVVTPMRFTVYENPSRVQIAVGRTRPDEQRADIQNDTKLRVRGGIKSEVVAPVRKGQSVTVLEQMETWSLVATDDALYGYVENKHLSDVRTETPEELISELAEVHPEELAYTTMQRPFAIKLGWHGIYGAAGNDTLSQVTETAAAMNVISPTWIYLNGSEGQVAHFCSADYVQQAHNMGLEVWAMVDNFTDDSVDIAQVLTVRANRSNLIRTLIDLKYQYNFDGINMDFEQLPSELGEAYTQLLRELSVECRKNGIVLSVDVPPAMEFNSHYDLHEMGIVTDYVIVMCYDEHYSTSPVAGSVASIGYVKNAIEAALKSVPADKVVGAVPFYTRFWRTDSAGLTQTTAGIASTPGRLAEYGIEVSWDGETGQNYGEVTTESGTRIQVWVEDAISIEEKLGVMQTAGIRNVAAWRLGYETREIWDVIASRMGE